MHVYFRVSYVYIILDSDHSKEYILFYNNVFNICVCKHFFG